MLPVKGASFAANGVSEEDPMAQQWRKARSVGERCLRTGVAALVVVLGVSVAGDRTARAEDPPAASSDEAALDPQALALARRMAERIAAAERIHVRGEVAWDSVQPDGQTLEFGALRELWVQRPDRLRVDVSPREGGMRRLRFDGARIVAEDVDAQVYAATPRSGSLDEIVGFVSDELGVPVALSEFLSPQLPSLLEQGLRAAVIVGAETIDGARCDRVALRNDVTGMQLWIGQEDALPRRITITYEHEEGRPQFRAHFAKWELGASIPASTFAFEPAAGAEKIAFARRAAAQSPSTTGAAQ